MSQKNAGPDEELSSGPRVEQEEVSIDQRITSQFITVSDRGEPLM